MGPIEPRLRHVLDHEHAVNLVLDRARDSSDLDGITGRPPAPKGPRRRHEKATVDDRRLVDVLEPQRHRLEGAVVRVRR
jgi:hypothetical protein